MKTNAKRVLVALLCMSLLAGSSALFGCAATERKDDFTMSGTPSYSFDLLASEKPEVNTTIPHTYLDFTEHYGFSGMANVSCSVTQGSHTTFTATADDPMTILYPPEFRPSQVKSVAIIYRTDMDKDGELYADRSDGVVMGQPGGTQVWRWVPSKEFTKIAVVCDAWKDADPSVVFTAFRFDPL